MLDKYTLCKQIDVVGIIVNEYKNTDKIDRILRNNFIFLIYN